MFHWLETTIHVKEFTSVVDNNLPEPKAALPPLKPEPEPAKKRTGQWILLVIAFLALAAAAVFVVLRFLAPAQAPVGENVQRNSNPGLDGVIAEGMAPDNLEVGECLRGFISPLEPQTIVTCDSAHNGQLIGTFELEGDQFPGADALLTQAEDLCKSIPLDPTAPLDSSWTYHFSRPSQGTWDRGDRLVSCFLSLPEGSIRTSLLPADEQS